MFLIAISPYFQLLFLVFLQFILHSNYNADQMKKKQPPVQEVKRPVDQYFENLNANFQNPTNRIFQIIFLPLFFFGLMGLIWMIPFPQFDFLVKLGWHTFLNWGSFFIAVLIYYYLKLSPTLSYAVLLCIGIMSYFIVQLEYIERDGGPSVLLVSGVITAVSLAALWWGKSKENKAISLGEFWTLISVGPIWLWHFVFRKVKLKY